MILEIGKASKFFGGVKALDDCSFGIEAQKITALIGPNGAGKTTLFNAVNGFGWLDSGQIIFAGRDVTDIPAWKRSRLGMSRSFQSARIFANLNLQDNLLLAARYDDDQFWKMILGKTEEREYLEKIKTVLEFVGLKKDLHAQASEMSYGQQKLFGIARALVNPHTLLLMDEPVAGVNPVIREELKQLMRRLKNDGETVLLIEHDMDFVRGLADFVIVMDQGRVIAQGLPETVLTDKRVLEAYLGK